MKKMKIFYSFIIIAASTFSLNAQQISLSETARFTKFNKLIDEINNGKAKLKYSDIQGLPYTHANFVKAKIGDTNTWIPIRYNSFLDEVEMMVNTDVYEVSREEAPAKFTFEKTNEKLVLVNTYDENAGYFFEIAEGKNRILKKIVTKFYDAVPAPNTMIAGSSARFETLKPTYFIKTETGLIKIPKNMKDLAASFPDRKDAVAEFVKTNKTKSNNEADLIKLNQFLNQ